jgi:DNA-binding PadR family transcriptional regulator
MPTTAPAATDLPLTPATFHILLSLAADERHGYGIMQEVEALTAGDVRLGPGTLYRTLRTLLLGGLIAEVGERLVPEANNERRRYYRLTAAGQRTAAAEAARLARLVALARERHLLDGAHDTRG